MPENIHFDHCFVLLRVVWCERGCYYGFCLKEIFKLLFSDVKNVHAKFKGCILMLSVYYIENISSS